MDGRALDKGRIIVGINQNKESVLTMSMFSSPEPSENAGSENANEPRHLPLPGQRGMHLVLFGELVPPLVHIVGPNGQRLGRVAYEEVLADQEAVMPEVVPIVDSYTPDVVDGIVVPRELVDQLFVEAGIDLPGAAS